MKPFHLRGDGPQQKYVYLDAICHNNEGSAVIGVSSLTNRYWTGAIKLYKKTTKDIDSVEFNSIFEVTTDCSVSNVKSLSKTNRIISTFDSGNVSLFESQKNTDKSLTLLTSENEHDGLVTNLAVSHSESKFVTTGSDHCINFWDSEEFLPTSTYNAHLEAVSGVTFHHECDEIILTSSEDSKVFLWDLRNSKPVSSIGYLGFHLPTSISMIPLSPFYYAIGTKSGSILILDVRTMTIVKCLECCSRGITSMYFSPLRPSMMALSSQDSSVAICLLKGSSEFQMLKKDNSHKQSVQEVSWNPVDGTLTSCSWDGTIKTHNINISL